MKFKLSKLFLLLFLVGCTIGAVFAANTEYKEREIPLACSPDSNITLTYKFRSKADISKEMKDYICSDNSEGLAKLSRAIAKYPNEAALYMERSTVYFSTYNTQRGATASESVRNQAKNKALADAKKAISLDSSNEKYYSNLSEMYFSSFDYKNAKIYNDKARELKKTAVNTALKCAIDLKLKDPNASLRRFPCPEAMKYEDSAQKL